ncbi:MAG: hypothetical protein WCS50_06610 [Bacilli bacterium]
MRIRADAGGFKEWGSARSSMARMILARSGSRVRAPPVPIT